MSVDEKLPRLRIPCIASVLIPVVLLAVVGVFFFGGHEDTVMPSARPTVRDDGSSELPAGTAMENVVVGNEVAGLSPSRIHKGSSVEVLFLAEGSGESNCYIVVDEQFKQAAVIDPGSRNCAELSEYLARRGIVPVYVLITHAHRDHLGGLDYFIERTNATAIAHRQEAARFPAACRPVSLRGSAAAENRFLYIDDEQDVEFGNVRLRAKLIPGHTIASLAFVLMGEDVVFSGDTLFRGSIGRTDLSGSTGQANLINNLRIKLMSLDDGTMVFPGHGSFTTVGQERTMNQFLGAAE